MNHLNLSPASRRHRCCWLSALCAVFILGLGGCASVDDHLVINADGSWSVTIEASTPMSHSQRIQASMILRMNNNEGGPYLYPPFNSDEARALFPNPDISVSNEAMQGDGLARRSVISGDNLAALIESPYAEIRQLRFDALDDGLQVSYIDPMRYLLPLIALDPDAESDQGQMAWVTQQLGTVKEHRHAWRSVQRITLPGLSGSDSSGQVSEGRATWDVAGEDNGTLTQASNQLLNLRYARGGALEVDLPEQPLRLGLRPFANLAVGSTGGSAKEVDIDQLKAVAKWLPVSLRVQRSFNYTGERHRSRDDSRLEMLLILPQEFAPTSWGTISLDDASAGDQVSLMPRHQTRHSTSRHHRQHGQDGPLADKAWQRYQVSFNSPPRDARHIDLVQVSTTLSFPGVPHVVKAAEFVAAEDILSEDASRSFSHSSEAIPFPGLEEVGLGLRRLRVSKQGPTLDVDVALIDNQEKLTTIQVFDAEGRPWPVLRHPYMSSSTSSNYLVLGHPQPPLSVAFLVDSGGVQLPLEHRFTQLPIHPPIDNDDQNQDDEE